MSMKLEGLLHTALAHPHDCQRHRGPDSQPIRPKECPGRPSTPPFPGSYDTAQHWTMDSPWSGNVPCIFYIRFARCAHSLTAIDFSISQNLFRRVTE